MVKDILLIIDNAERARLVIDAAVAMASRLDSDLTIEILTCGPLMIPALAPMTEMYVPEEELVGEEAARVKAVSAIVASAPCTTRVLGLHDDAFALVRRAGRAGPIADLIVMGGRDLWETEWLRIRATETVIMGCGSPLMILDGKVTPLPIRHAAIGWKDTTEARRAVHDLVTLLEPGSRVSVVAVGHSEGENAKARESLNEVVRHLARHGLNAEGHQILDEGQKDAQALEGFAVQHGAELLAIGAFAHSRLREIAFGGVTHSMIERAPLPLLLSQ